MTSLVILVMGFASGIFFRSFFVLHGPAISFVFGCAILFLVAYGLYSRKEYAYIALFFICIGCGVLRTTHKDTPPPKPFVDAVGSRVSYNGVVVTDPDVRDKNQRVTVEVVSENVTTRILAVTNRTPVVSVGDTVRLYGTLSLPQPFAGDGGRMFRYDTYLQKSGVRFMIEYAVLTPVSSPSWWSVTALFARIKHTFIRGIDAVLPEPYASLASGMVVGGKQGLGAELLDAFTLAGLVQIVVLSGYNVMVVAEAVMAGLSRLLWTRKVATACGAGAVVLFVLIAGAGAATVRAGLMALIALYARATGRTYAASRALLVVVLAMLLWNPLLLVFDPGFDLSVLATAGLIWLAPLVEPKLKYIQSAFWKNATATTIAAQVAVLPLLLYDIGTLSWVSIPANLVTLPVVPFTMAFSTIAGIAGLLFGGWALPMGLVIAFPAYLLNRYIVGVAYAAGAIPFAAVTIPAFPFWIVMGAYGLLIIWIWHAHTKGAATKVATPLVPPRTTPRPAQIVSQ